MKVWQILTALTFFMFLVCFNASLFFTKIYFSIFWNDKDLSKIFQILNFFKGVSVDFLNKSEIMHIIDVRDVFYKIIVLRDVSLVIFVFGLSFLIVKKQVSNIFKYSGVFLLCFLLFCVFCFAFFDDFFIIFHEIVFPNGNWEFPASSELIRLFPKQFWINVFLHFSFLTFVEMLLCFVIYKICRSWDLNPGTD